jgi:hypothetical protein
MSEYTDTVAFSISVTLENDSEHKTAVVKAVCERIRDGMGQDNANPDDYREMLNREGIHNMSYDVRDVVSDYVMEMVATRLGGKRGLTMTGEYVTFMPDDMPALVISGLFDFMNADLWADIAYRFIPETPEDYADILQWAQNDSGEWFTPGDCTRCGLRNGH